MEMEQFEAPLNVSKDPQPYQEIDLELGVSFHHILHQEPSF